MPASRSPIVFYQDYFHPGSDIRTVHALYEAYRARGRDSRPIYHFRRQDADLPELIAPTQSTRPVGCGNRGCKADLRYVAHDRLFCPGCGKPILNRCGNRDCTADDVLRSVKQATGKQAKETVLACPTCQLSLRTYWWFCPEPAHAERPIALDKTHCPECLREYRGCANPTPDPTSPYGPLYSLSRMRRGGAEGEERHPEELASWYRDGVNGGKDRDFWPIIERYNRKPFLCPSGHPRLHFTFPTCPTGANDPLTQHHVYRGPAVDHKGRFQCGSHPDHEFYECDNCDYPILLTVADRLARKAKRCPRCLKLVNYCFTCSDRDWRLLIPDTDNDCKEEICPRCDNPMDRLPPLRGLAGADSNHRGFCGNLFGCRAGAEPWQRQARLASLICEACVEEPRQRLQPAVRLPHIVYACPVCTLLLGLPEAVARSQSETLPVPAIPLNGPIKRLTAAECAELPIERFEQDPDGAGRQSCPICSFRRDQTHALIRQSQENQTLKDALDVLEVLRTTPVNNDARQSLHDSGTARNAKEFEEIVNLILTLVDESLPSGQVLCRRLRQIQAAFSQWNSTVP